jgi:hypothetical protein
MAEHKKNLKLIQARIDADVANGVSDYAVKTGIKKQRVIENFLKDGLDKAET